MSFQSFAAKLRRVAPLCSKKTWIRSGTLCLKFLSNIWSSTLLLSSLQLLKRNNFDPKYPFTNLQNLGEQLQNLDCVTKMLHCPITTLLNLRIIFDVVLPKHQTVLAVLLQLGGRLLWRILVPSLHIWKIQKDNKLALVETTKISQLFKESLQTRVSFRSQKLLFADHKLNGQRRDKKLYQLKHIFLRFAIVTTNILVWHFSVVKFEISTRHKSVLHINSAEQILSYVDKHPGISQRSTCCQCNFCVRVIPKLNLKLGNSNIVAI